MKQLFISYSAGEIIIFIIIAALAIKELINFIDWADSRIHTYVKQKDKPEQILHTTQNHDKQLKQIKNQIEQLRDSIQLLIESDKDDIKLSITKEHHYFCYQLGYIDDYSLDCLERRYECYQIQGGNSFIQDLMKDLRSLPKKSQIQLRKKGI